MEILLFLLLAVYPLYWIIKWGFAFLYYGKDLTPPEVNLSGKLHEPPSDLKPYFVNTLVNKTLTPTGGSISSTLLELVRLKYIKISHKGEPTLQNRRYYFELDEKRAKDISKLPKLEQRLLSFIFQGTGNIATFSEIKTYGVRKASVTHKFWRFWKDEVPYQMVKNMLIDEESYYAKETLNTQLSILFTIAIISLYVTVESGSEIISIFTITVFIIAIILKSLNKFMFKRTATGNEEYAKWLAFKRWLTDFSVTKNYPIDSLILWEKFLVYGVALGVSKKALSELPINYHLVDLNESVFSEIILTRGSMEGQYDMGLFMSELLEFAALISGIYSQVEREEKDIIENKKRKKPNNKQTESNS